MPAEILFVANCTLMLAATTAAIWLRPWRRLSPGGPTRAWLPVCAIMPLLWSLDHLGATSVAQPVSCAALLVLLAGWPLTVLALLPVAGVTVLAGDLGWIEGLHRLVWLGLVPATIALAIGAGVRRWLPNHLFVYILGRGYFATLVASALAGSIAYALHPSMPDVPIDQVLVARLLVAFGEAFVTGMVIAGLVAMRPGMLATYSDRLYLPP